MPEAAAGRRRPLLLLPGMLCDGRVFGPQIAHLGESCDIHVADLAGHATIEALAASVLDAAPFDSFAACGLSMGGIVLMAMMRLAPERIERAALLDTSHRADPPHRRAWRDRQVERVRAGFMREVVVEELKPNYLAERNRRDAGLLDLLIRMALDAGPTTFETQSLALRDRADASPTLARFTRPALVLCGEEDALCPPARAREMAALLSGADLVIVPGAGHIATLESPLSVNAALARWLIAPPPALKPD